MSDPILHPDPARPLPPAAETSYTPAPAYMLYAVVSVALVIGFVWLLIRQAEAGAILFLGVAVFAALWAVRNLFSRVTLDATGVTLLRPWQRPQRVQFRQLSEVSEEGRLLRVIVALYHPLQADGLVNIDDLSTLSLPALEGQSELLELLQAKMPH